MELTFICTECVSISRLSDLEQTETESGHIHLRCKYCKGWSFDVFWMNGEV